MDYIAAASIYKLMSIRGVGPRLANRVLERLRSLGENLERFIPTDDFLARLNGLLTVEQALEWKSPDDRISTQVREIQESGGGFISRLDDAYPSKLLSVLGAEAPPLLSYFGELRLLDIPSVGFCGSRKASDKGIETAMDCADQIAAAGAVVVSGNAAGIDATAHLSSLKALGSTIIVAPEGLLRFRVRRELKQSWSWDRVLVVSEFQPGVVWSAGQAMQRNKTIIGLSDVMVVIEAGLRGGTMDCGKSALELCRPLFVPVYAGMSEAAAGNQYLIEHGGVPLKKSRESNRASLGSLLDRLSNTNLGAGLDSNQRSLML